MFIAELDLPRFDEFDMNFAAHGMMGGRAVSGEVMSAL